MGVMRDTKEVGSDWWKEAAAAQGLGEKLEQGQEEIFLAVLAETCNVTRACKAAGTELPGCMADGETRAEALERIEDAMLTWVFTAKGWAERYRRHVGSTPRTFIARWDAGRRQLEGPRPLFFRSEHGVVRVQECASGREAVRLVS